MRPLILKYAEQIDAEELDMSSIIYDEEFQLSVIKGTKTPAFDSISSFTKTFTKADGEGTDDTASGLQGHLHTITYSAINSEVSDSDETRPELSVVLFTKTQTFTTSEETDEDSPPPMSLSTKTNTRDYKEETDCTN
jgi:hypothetical protein